MEQWPEGEILLPDALVPSGIRAGCKVDQRLQGAALIRGASGRVGKAANWRSTSPV